MKVKSPCLYLMLLLTASVHCIAQDPAINWQNSIGGTQNDYLSQMFQKPDGHIIVCGSSNTNVTGDKTLPTYGLYDIWLYELDPYGNILWQKVFGGSLEDDCTAVFQTSDGGYMIGGDSESNISGNKSQNSYGEMDYWIIKLDSNWNIEWDRTYGGDAGDYLKAIIQTEDGGYILAGTSISGISGVKTEPEIGGAGDIWIVKIGPSGDIIWQNTIGGEFYESSTDIIETSDGGFLCGAYSQSNSSPDKSEDNIGGLDFWLIKLNADGGIVWENTIGGTNSDIPSKIFQTADSGFVIGGYSSSSTSIDKTEPNMGAYGTSDFWILKTDSNGTILWQNVIGGENDDFLYDFAHVADGGYLATGVSYSGISGDKTDSTFGWGDYWVIKLDSLGSILWDITLGGTAYDYPSEVLSTYDGRVLVGGSSTSVVSGNKTDPTVGLWDNWIIELSCVPIPELCNGYDDDCDGLIDEDVFESVSIEAFGPTTFCQGDSVELIAGYTGDYIQWFRNGIAIAGATNANYMAKTKGAFTAMTMGTCDTAISTELNVLVRKNPPALISAGGPVTFCAGGSVTLTANAGFGLQYQWFRNAAILPGATSMSYLATVAGVYKCQVTKTASGCSKMSPAITVSVPCRGDDNFSFSEKEETAVIQIYPNPVSDLLYVHLDIAQLGIELSDQIYLSVTNVNGAFIDTYKFVAGEILELNVSNFSSGVYFGYIQLASAVYVAKFVVE